jgi:hypothetical protein
MQLRDHAPRLMDSDVHEWCVTRQLKQAAHVTRIAFDGVGAQAPLVGDMGEEPIELSAVPVSR